MREQQSWFGTLMPVVEPHAAGSLLAVVYIAFIGLGLPDTVLGAVWPPVRQQFGLPLDAAGQAVLLTMMGVATSSLAAGRLINRFGTGAILVGSSLLAAVALMMNAAAPSWGLMLAAAIAGGLAGGAIDTAMNGFVARHYSARHMNWLHGFWGVGATLGPFTVAATLQQTGSWRRAYATLAGAELILFVLFVLMLPRWRNDGRNRGQGPSATRSSAASLGWSARASVLTFASYGALEASLGLWSATFLIGTRGVTAAAAGAAVAAYWGSLTGGRLLLGAFAGGGKEMLLVRCGLWATLPALLVLGMPGLPFWSAVVALCVLGAALGPVYPTLMHDTPRRYGDEAGTRLVGYQVAACSVGVAAVPWLIGVVIRSTTVAFLPGCLAALAAATLVFEQLRRRS